MNSLFRSSPRGALALSFSLSLSLLLASTTVGARAAASNQAAAASDWIAPDHVPFAEFIVQSHRGAGVLAEENTVHAFEVGWGLGTYPESDLRTTSDGVIVTFHDDNFSRVVKGVTPELAHKGVKDLTYAELMKLDVGSWKGDQFVGRRISKLSDAFAAMQGHPERHLYLDIKNVDFPKLADEVRAAHVEKQIVLASPKPEQLVAWKKLVPESETLLWMRGGDRVLRAKIEKLRKVNFAGITQLQIHIFPNRTLDQAMTIAGTTVEKLGISADAAKNSSEPFTPSSSFIVELGRELRSHHILFQTLPYTDDTGVYAPLLDLGVMSFATDHPDVTMREIKAYYERHQAKSVAH
ncbi:MAG TPA: glycerophosphodiester phosphodiesterase family protein [Opitutaceae bacterium]|nr:glycerophosphodiester phosphodiesterase family protein [Opitutaceae bacterium]